MIYPRVHLNGTSRKELLEQLESAGRAVIAARKALANSFPHARDYYVVSDSAYTQARAEWNVRLALLTTLRNDILDIYQNVEAQGKRDND